MKKKKISLPTPIGQPLNNDQPQPLAFDTRPFIEKSSLLTQKFVDTMSKIFRGEQGLEAKDELLQCLSQLENKNRLDIIEPAFLARIQNYFETVLPDKDENRNQEGTCQFENRLNTKLSLEIILFEILEIILKNEKLRNVVNTHTSFNGLKKRIEDYLSFESEIESILGKNDAEAITKIREFNEMCDKTSKILKDTNGLSNNTVEIDFLKKKIGRIYLFAKIVRSQKNCLEHLGKVETSVNGMISRLEKLISKFNKTQYEALKESNNKLQDSWEESRFSFLSGKTIRIIFIGPHRATSSENTDHSPNSSVKYFIENSFFRIGETSLDWQFEVFRFLDFCMRGEWIKTVRERNLSASSQSHKINPRHILFINLSLNSHNPL